MVSDFTEDPLTVQRTHLVWELGEIEGHSLVDFLFPFYRMTLGVEGWRRIDSRLRTLTPSLLPHTSPKIPLLHVYEIASLS